MRTLVLIASIFAAAEAPAAETTGPLAVVAVGECGEPILLEASRSVRRELARTSPQVLSEEATAAPGGGMPGLSISEVQRVIESGKTDFLNLEVDRAEKTLRDSLAEIDRLPLGPQRWTAYWEARAWLARIVQYANQRAKATEVFLQILKVQEDFQLNRVDFPPSARELLEMTRSLLPGLPRFKLAIASRTGKGHVYLNGFDAGPAPFEKKLIGGEYEVVVADGARQSFKRKVVLSSDSSLTVDLDREAPFTTELGPCYRTGPDREERLRGAVLVAGALHASQIIAVRSERLGGEDYVAAALIEVPKGREVREGRVRREGGKLPQLTRLAQFVLTGEGSPDPLPVAASSAPPPTGKPPKLWQGPLSYALLGAAAVLAGVAIYEQIHAGDLQRQMDALVVGGQVPSADYPKYLSLRSSATDARNARTGLAIGAGVVGLGGGAFLAWSLWPEPRAGTAGRSTLATGIAISGNF